MTLLIPLLLRLTTLFEREVRVEEPSSENHVISEEETVFIPEKE